MKPPFDLRSLYTLFPISLVQAGLGGLVEQAHMAGTKMIPAVSYVLSLLALKLLDKERKSHITDWNFQEALGWFAGLNVPPKTTAATDYAYRLADGVPNRLLAHWVRAVYAILCPEGAQAFALDFHAIPHKGEDTGLENHYVPMRGKAVQSVLTCFARALDAPMLCYAQADVVLTVLANGCYRWLSQRLKGCERMEPKQLYRKFVETGGHLTVRGEKLVVSFDRRAHNPVIAQAHLDHDAPPIPWLQNKRLRLEFK